MQTPVPPRWPADSLLGQVHGRIRDTLLALGMPIGFRPRQTMIRQGEEGGHTLLLLSGYVKVVVNTTFGQDVLLAVRGAGNLCGEMAVLERRRRCANVIACVPVHGRLISRQQLTEFLDQYPQACLAVARTISERLRWANERRAEFVACPAAVRVARVLIAVAWREGGFTVPLSQPEVASLAGVAPGTVEKALQTMERAGLLRRGYRRIVIVAPARLSQFAQVPAKNPY